MRERHKWIPWSLSSAGVILVLALGFKFGPLERLEWQGVDALQRRQSEYEPPCSDLRFVVLDQTSLDAGEANWGFSWPWPREAYARVLDFLQRGGARCVLLDFTFTEPSGFGPGDDELLVAAVKNNGRVFLPLVGKAQGAQKAAAEFFQARPDLLLPLSADPTGSQAPLQGLSLPRAALFQVAAGLGNVAFQADPDGICRRIRPIWNVAGHGIPNFGLAPLLAHAAAQPGLLSEGQTLTIGGQTLPLDVDGQMLLRFPGIWSAYPKNHLSDIVAAEAALQEGRVPEINPEIFRDKVVVIGSTAESLLDLRKTPLSSETPGFFIMASVWAAAAHGLVYDDRGRVQIFWLMLVLMASLGSWFGGWRLGFGLAATLACGLLGTALGIWFFWVHHVLVFLLTPLMALGLGFGLRMGWSYRQAQKQKQFIQGAFSQILSPAILEKLIQEPGRLTTGGEQTELTVYFSDLAGFTQFSEKLPPKELVRILNLYLTEMIATIVDEGEGYVDKFIGDAVMAFWGAPVPESAHAYRACLAALRNQHKLKKLQPELTRLGLNQELKMRIGLHTGPAVVGMMGSQRKLNYTIIGDTVNLASRLEGVNKFYDTSILISQETHAALGGRLVTREIDLIRVKGKQAPTRIYELLAEPGELTGVQREHYAHYQAGMELYWKKEFAKARTCFARACKADPTDYPAQLYMKRCENYRNRPPGPHWDGVTVLKSK
ncbi:MAG: CHASE2 domain-containing protein [Candidatus Firestonebacteria bacterium]|nr:CHASE2 domain-containing protein [Candidatus Firestonebacteria bacterium]